MNLSPLEKRHGLFQHQRFEVRRLPVIKKRLLTYILLVQQKFIWVVVRSVNDELEVARLSTNFLGQRAQDRFDFLDLAVARTPAGYDYMCHCFTWRTTGELRRLPTIASPPH